MIWSKCVKHFIKAKKMGEDPSEIDEDYNLNLKGIINIIADFTSVLISSIQQKPIDQQPIKTTFKSEIIPLGQ